MSHVWTRYVTTEAFGLEERRTLDHIFSHDGVQIWSSYIELGFISMVFMVPWRNGDGMFNVCMQMRLACHAGENPLRYVVPCDGPFAGVQPLLAGAITIELCQVMLLRIYTNGYPSRFRAYGEFDGSFLPLIGNCVRLSDSINGSVRSVVSKLRTLRIASNAAERIEATDVQVGHLRRAAFVACVVKARVHLEYAVVVMYGLFRWIRRAKAAAWAPGSAAFLATRDHFASLAHRGL